MAGATPNLADDPLAGLALTERPEGVRFSLHAKPRASRTKVVGVREGALDLAVAAPPVDGAANEEICSFLAGSLGVAKRDVQIVSGAAGRQKIVEVARTGEDVRARLARLVRGEVR